MNVSAPTTKRPANLAAAQANVGRLQKLQGFNQVVAPFDGVVTRRNIDVGDLVNAGNGGTGQALFAVAQVDPLRLYVYVPQVYAPEIKVGAAVTVTLAERAGEQYQGTVARTARAIDTATRTMQVEIRVPNPTGALIVGSYVQVTLPVNVDAQALVVPTNVLLFRPEGTRIALVDSGGRVHLAPVKLGTDFGTRVEVLSGLAATDRMILNPADSLADGDVVTLTRRKPRASCKPRAASDADASAAPCVVLDPPPGPCRVRCRPRLPQAGSGRAARMAAGCAVARGGAERRRTEGRLVAAVPGRCLESSGGSGARRQPEFACRGRAAGSGARAGHRRPVGFVSLGGTVGRRRARQNFGESSALRVFGAQLVDGAE